MAEFFRTSSGVILEVDVPRAGTMARERHDDQVAKGDLVVVNGTPVKVDVPGGGYRWELPAGPPAGPDPIVAEPTTESDSPEEADAPDVSADEDEVPSGSVADVLAWVAGDPARAQAALDAEVAGKNRKGLVTELEDLLDS